MSPLIASPERQLWRDSNRRAVGQGSIKGGTPFCRGGLARGGSPCRSLAEAVKAGVVKEGDGFGVPLLRGNVGTTYNLDLKPFLA